LPYFFPEDILRRDNAIWISPNGESIVYATFNDSLVQEVRWKIYGNPSDAIIDPYPKETKMRYPKVRKNLLWLSALHTFNKFREMF